MSCSGLLVGLSIWLSQVPAPASDPSREVDRARRSIAAREAAELNTLADRLARQGDADGAEQVRRRLPPQIAPDGPTRVIPLPEIVAARSAEPTGAGPPPLARLESKFAAELFELAQRAAGTEPPCYSAASQLLRSVIERQPDHSEARRLLGYVPHQGGWAKPFAVSQIQKGYVNHPVFGWVLSDWVAHLDRGELPAPSTRNQKKARWLSREEADRLRADGDPPWHIFTEHFEIQSNVTLAEAIRFGRKLEAFHDLFTTILADILGDKLPLVRRFKDKSMTGEPASKAHLVTYFASKDDYLEYLTPRYGQKIAGSLGFYDPPKRSVGGRAPAFFFRDPNGQIPADSTLYHEVSHQLLFETAGPHAYNKNFGNYWVFEGLGTYFETVTPRPDGSLEVGGLVGVRMEHAIRSIVDRGHAIPIEAFVALGEAAFMRDDPEIFLRYQQAMALTVFLMQWHDGAYRADFLDYVRDAYRGRIKAGSGRRLDDRLGQTYKALDAQFVAFLKGEPEGAEPTKPTPEAARAVPAGGIRTVPRPSE